MHKIKLVVGISAKTIFAKQMLAQDTLLCIVYMYICAYIWSCAGSGVGLGDPCEYLSTQLILKFCDSVILCVSTMNCSKS